MSHYRRVAVRIGDGRVLRYHRRYRIKISNIQRLPEGPDAPNKIPAGHNSCGKTQHKEDFEGPKPIAFLAFRGHD